MIELFVVVLVDMAKETSVEEAHGHAKSGLRAHTFFGEMVYVPDSCLAQTYVT